MIADVSFTDGGLVVRPLRAEDAPALRAAAHEGGETHPYSPTHPGDPAYLDAALAGRAAGTDLPFILELDGRCIGSTRYADIREPHRGLEIGWTWYVPRVRRTWVNATVKRMLLRHAFEELGMVRVQLKCDARNAASRAAIAALGAVEEGTLRAHLRLPDGFQRDTVMFSILAAEWPAVETRLGTRIAARRGTPVP